jgi:capsular polysaccharide export protein
MEGLPWVPADSDPWHLCAQAELVIADAGDEAALVAALIGTEVEIVGSGRFSALAVADGLEEVVQRELCSGWSYRDPFDGEPMAPISAIEMLGRWRKLIDANREVAAVYGVARWKRITADVLLWDGSGPVRHESGAKDAARNGGPRQGDQVLAWVARADGTHLAALEARGTRVGEIEDGMIRSTGLGANCVPPLSIVVDKAGPHFDPEQASTLESILQDAEIGPDLLSRAAVLREWLVAKGISKYGQDEAHRISEAKPGGRRRVLVTGQVEDDRSVLRGGGGLGNLELLRRARAVEPDAWIVFKPHPDVEAGHRKGRVPDPHALEYADEIDRTSSIAALLDRVEGVHVLTSLAGFEALLRGCDVTTHGVPFYAGWGLTRDLGPVPPRRSRKRNIDELVAATLILYPRYLDPVTRLPCEPEILVQRIADGDAIVRSPLVRLREIQGRINRLAGMATWRRDR